LERDTNIRRDIASAYVAAGTRVVSWIAVSALVYRTGGPAAFAMLALVRATLGLLNYATVGLAPAMIHFLPARKWAERNVLTPLVEGADPPAIDYAPAGEVFRHASGPDALYCNGVALAWAAAVLAGGMLVAYEFWFTHRRGGLIGFSPTIVSVFLTTMGIGTIFRLAGDPASAMLQVRGHVAGDNALLAMAEILWMVFSFSFHGTLRGVGVSFLLAGAALSVARSCWAFTLSGILLPDKRLIRPAILRALLAFGAVVTLAQVADFLYAPTDYILIDRLLRPIDIAAYAPAVQIDGGLWLLATALASVVLPRAALAHAADDRPALRKYYLRGTLATAALLGVACTLMWLISPWFLRIWLGHAMPQTQALLPIVLLNTLIGGSSAVGRSILLGVGRVRPFAGAVLAAGVTNVIFSWGFVRFGGLGLRGIVLGTSVAVIFRCALWMPWYVLRTLRSNPAI
jgi:O-antigen/teichoic acid export membrane protein